MRTDAQSDRHSVHSLIGRGGLVCEVARGLAAAGVLLSAAVHLDLWDVQDYRHIHVIGPLFLLNVIGGLIIGVAVLVWRHWLPALAAAGFGTATLIGFWISVTIGLFGFTESATGSAQTLAEIAESAAVLFGVVAAALSSHTARLRPWRARRAQPEPPSPARHLPSTGAGRA